MPGKMIQIHGRAGIDFDCYLVMPQADVPVPAVVLASAVHGVDKDLRDLADEFASHGYIAAAPDLFWRTIPGPLTRADGERAAQRAQPRAEKIKTGELDGVTVPVCIIWGDDDNQAPPEVLDAYRAVANRMSNVDLHIFPGIK